MAYAVTKAPPAMPTELRSEPCDACGAPTFELRCKVICRNCGYIRDCSDP